MSQVPITAWEQAVIVALFAFLLLAFLAGVYLFVRQLIRQLTDFIERRDEDWQSYFDKREIAFTERNSAIVKAIESLIMKFDAHDRITSQAITRMEERTRPLKNYPPAPQPPEEQTTKE